MKDIYLLLIASKPDLKKSPFIFLQWDFSTCPGESFSSSPECVAVNYNAFSLESSCIPSYVSCSFDKAKASSGSTSALEEAALKSTAVTKTETVMMKAEGKKEKVEEEEKEVQQQAATEEPDAVEKKEPEKVESEAVAEEWFFSILFREIYNLLLEIKKNHDFSCLLSPKKKNCINSKKSEHNFLSGIFNKMVLIEFKYLKILL